jgi:hypothetical protein
MNEANQRLFFALWPDASMAEALATLAQQVAAESGGRPTAPGHVHVTLAFLGDQPRRIARELSAGGSNFGACVRSCSRPGRLLAQERHRLGGRAKRAAAACRVTSGAHAIAGR